MNSTVSAPPPLPRAKSSQNVLIVWAVVATAAAIVFGIVAFLFFAQSQGVGLLPKPLPVEVGYRPALLGDGYVLHLHSTSGKSLPLNVTVTNPTFKKTRTYQIVLDGGAHKEIGHFEGWTLASGDGIQVAHDGYLTLSVSIP